MVSVAVNVDLHRLFLFSGDLEDACKNNRQPLHPYHVNKPYTPVNPLSPLPGHIPSGYSFWLWWRC